MLTNIEVPQKPDTFGVVPERMLLFGEPIKVVKIEEQTEDWLNFAQVEETLKSRKRHYNRVDNLSSKMGEDYILEDSLRDNVIHTPNINFNATYAIHLAVTGKTDHGKSWCVIKLISLINKRGIPIIGVDPNDQLIYNKYDFETIRVTPNKYFRKTPFFTKSDIFYKVIENKIIYDYKELSFQEFTNMLVKKAYDKSANVIISVREDFFEDKNRDASKEINKQFVGAIAKSVLDVGMQKDYDYHTGKIEEKPRLFYVMEECEDYTKYKTEHCARKIITLVKQGRKYGTGSILSTQRLSGITEEILSQMFAIIAGKLAIKGDRDSIKDVYPEIGQPKNQEAYLRLLGQLDKGEFTLIQPNGDDQGVFKMKKPKISNIGHILNQIRNLKYDKDTLSKIST